MAVHRVVPTDRQQGKVDRVAFADQLHVPEQAGVAGVVDGLAAEVDHQPRGQAHWDAGGGAERRLLGARKGVGVEGLDELHPAPVEVRGAAEVQVVDLLDALLAEPVGDLDQRHGRRA